MSRAVSLVGIGAVVVCVLCVAALAKIAAAREIAKHMQPDRNRSKSFIVLRDGLKAMLAS